MTAPPSRDAASVVERLLWWVADKAERAAFRMKEARRGNT